MRSGTLSFKANNYHECGRLRRIALLSPQDQNPFQVLAVILIEIVPWNTEEELWLIDDAIAVETI